MEEEEEEADLSQVPTKKNKKSSKNSNKKTKPELTGNVIPQTEKPPVVEDDGGELIEEDDNVFMNPGYKESVIESNEGLESENGLIGESTGPWTVISEDSLEYQDDDDNAVPDETDWEIAGYNESPVYNEVTAAYELVRSDISSSLKPGKYSNQQMRDVLNRYISKEQLKSIINTKLLINY